MDKTAESPVRFYTGVFFHADLGEETAFLKWDFFFSVQTQSALPFWMPG